nr:hypothetical protein [Tanacetum cinerariifolium]
MLPLSEARVAELIVMPTPPPSPFNLMSSPLPQIPSPPLFVPSSPPMPSSPLLPPVLVKTHAPEQDVAAALLIIGFEVGESLAATAARPPKHLYGFVDTTKAEASITRRHARTLHDTECRMMTVVEVVNLRVSYEAQTHQRDGTLFEDAYIELHEDLLRSEAHNKSLEAHNRSLVARIETIGTRMTEMDDQFQDTKDRANVASAYTAGPGEKKAYTGNQPLCTKCNYHHTGQCAPKCNNCKKYGHATRECRVNVNNNRVQKMRTCFECGEPGHFKKNCPKLKNNGNAYGNDEARRKAYVMGEGDSNPKSNTVTGTFLFNNRYALILFDTGANRSFVSTIFSALIKIAPTTLDNQYDVKLADGKII